MEAVACSVCHRVLYAKDGPTCPECLAKEPVKEPKVKVEAKDEESNAS